MDLTALLIALIIGAVAGWLAGQLVEGTGFGLLGDILVGIVGAVIASLLFPSLGLHWVVECLPPSLQRPSERLSCF